ncbi:hypothetical protein QBC44DRAFT_334264 [Cladorrhinum sp. PSN332]|nr:hypothetical protein QBC44DRAFT_334264 [Cladorrhinum sp. PSN332]
MANCSGLDSIRNLGEYTDRLSNATSFNDTLLMECQVPICTALWGLGVPDLSGIGIAVGYLVSAFLGFFLPLLILAVPPRRARLQRIFTAGLASFFDSAIYFAFAVQAATITALAPKDWEAQTTTFGDFEVRISGLVSALCLLPLLCPIALLPFVNTTTNNSDTKARTSYRLTLWTITVIVSFYPFVSQSIRNFAQTQAGDGKGDGGGTDISDVDWAKVRKLCFATLSARDHRIMRAFQLLASLSVLLFTIGALVPPGLRRLNHNFPGKSAVWEIVSTKLDAGNRIVTKHIAWLRYILISTPVLLAAPLFWGFWKLRALQKSLSMTITGYYEGDEWGFGQVMAIAIFLPVIAEMVFAWRRGRYGNDKQGESERKR